MTVATPEDVLTIEARSVFEANTALQDDLEEAMRRYTANIRNLRVLDYGAGAVPFSKGPFGGLQRDQAPVISYDPMVISYESKNERGIISTRGVNEEPRRQKFNLVGCRFSLHHIGSPNDVLEHLDDQYNPDFLVIVEYDYKGTSEEEFERSFTSQTERKELENMFGGNVRACHEFHSRFGVKEYKQALYDNEFRVLTTEKGQDEARYKFFTIAEKFYPSF